MVEENTERNLEILHRWESGATSPQLAEQYGISRARIERIVKDTARKNSIYLPARKVKDGHKGVAVPARVDEKMNEKLLALKAEKGWSKCQIIRRALDYYFLNGGYNN